MKMLMCSLFDRVAQKHLPPFLVENKDVALRAMRGALTNDQHLRKNHQDFDVYSIGIFDQDSGHIDLHREHICTVTSCLPQEG